MSQIFGNIYKEVVLAYLIFYSFHWVSLLSRFPSLFPSYNNE